MVVLRVPYGAVWVAGWSETGVGDGLRLAGAEVAIGLPLRSAWLTRTWRRRSTSAGGSSVRGGDRLTASANEVATEVALVEGCGTRWEFAAGFGDVDLGILDMLEKNFFLQSG